MATPFMNLTLPVVSSTIGPAWATQLNVAVTSIDSHNHSAGQGAPVPTAGININLDLPFNLFNATLLRSTRFSSQAAPLALGSDANCVYVSGGNLYYNNGAGQNVQITSGTALAASSLGGISGLSGTTGTASYSTISGTFTWQSNTNVAATMDSGPLVVRDVAASALGITVKSPVGLAGAYSLTLPAALPGSTKILTVSATGVIGDAYDVDNTTLQVISNVLSVKVSGLAGITTSNLSASAGIVGTQLANNTVTRTQLAAVGQQVSTSSAFFSTTSAAEVDVTNLAVTITTSGRPVVLMIIADGTISPFTINASNGTPQLYFDRAGSNIAIFQPLAQATFMHFDPVAAGTYTYKVRLKSDGTQVAQVLNAKLVAYEL